MKTVMLADITVVPVSFMQCIVSFIVINRKLDC